MLRRAFTLIELLVVIAIIAILAAILFPVFAQAKMAAKKTVSLSNVKQISLGLNMYATDNDDVIMPIATYIPKINQTSTTSEWAPAHSLMQPYVKSYSLWTAPADPHRTFTGGTIWDGSLLGKNLPLSYLYAGNVRTVQAAGVDQNTGIGPTIYNGGDMTKTRSTTSFDEPSNTISFAEAWSDGLVGIVGGSSLYNCDYEKLAGRKKGDPLPTTCNTTNDSVTKGYASGTGNYAMTDGSAKSLTWGQVRQNDFYKFKVAKPTTVVTP